MAKRKKNAIPKKFSASVYQKYDNLGILVHRWYKWRFNEFEKFEPFLNRDYPEWTYANIYKRVKVGLNAYKYEYSHRMYKNRNTWRPSGYEKFYPKK